MKQKTILIITVAAVHLLTIIASITLNPTATDIPKKPEISDFAAEHVIELSEYPKELVELLERNPETKDFVMNYPLYKDKEFDTTVLLPEDGSVPLLLQWDKRWGYKRYSGEMMALSGSGISAYPDV